MMGPADEVYGSVINIERFPSLMPIVEEVRVVHDSGSERQAAWTVRLRGSLLKWEERALLDPSARRVEFRQLNGDLDVFFGHWLVTHDSRAEVSITFRIGIPILADMLHPIAAEAIADSLRIMLEALGGTSIETTSSEVVNADLYP